MRPGAAALLLLALAACGGHSDDQPTDQQGLERKDPGAPTTFGPDFTELKLGPKLEGSEFTARIRDPQGRNSGKLEGYVACAEGLASCDDGGEKPVYTYVLKVSPRAASSAFRTAERAYGFTGIAGFDKAQARAAMPGDSRLVMLCSDGVLVWAVDGGEGWSGEPITLYWQSDQRPAPESAKSYVLITDGVRSTAVAPFPTEGSTDKCR